MHFGCLIMAAYTAADCSGQAQCIVKTVTMQAMASKTQEVRELLCSHHHNFLQTTEVTYSSSRRDQVKQSINANALAASVLLTARALNKYHSRCMHDKEAA